MANRRRNHTRKAERLKTFKDCNIAVSPKYRLVEEGCYLKELMMLCIYCSAEMQLNIFISNPDERFNHDQDCKSYSKCIENFKKCKIEEKNTLEIREKKEDELDHCFGNRRNSITTDAATDIASYGRDNDHVYTDSIDLHSLEQSGSVLDKVEKKAPIITPDSVELKQPIRFESFKTLQQRLITFNEHWPHKKGKMSARRAALSGFAFANFETALRCFQCAIGLKGFVEDDDPFEEHRIYSPNCEYNNIAMQNNWNREPIPEDFFK